MRCPMDTKTLFKNQAEEARCYKWIQSQKAGHDLGENAVIEWVKKYAAKYREEYNDCFHQMVEMVITEVEDNKLCKEIKHPDLEAITELIIEKFTEKWIIEVAKENHNKHLEEL